MSLKVAIAGGGVGGLAAALALSESGQQVELFEKAATFSEIGAGIQLGPNATRLLHAWGLKDALQACSSRVALGPSWIPAPVSLKMAAFSNSSI